MEIKMKIEREIEIENKSCKLFSGNQKFICLDLLSLHSIGQTLVFALNKLSVFADTIFGLLSFLASCLYYSREQKPSTTMLNDTAAPVCVSRASLVC